MTDLYKQEDTMEKCWGCGEFIGTSKIEPAEKDSNEILYYNQEDVNQLISGILVWLDTKLISGDISYPTLEAIKKVLKEELGTEL